jgi:hypothetical protein
MGEQSSKQKFLPSRSAVGKEWKMVSYASKCYREPKAGEDKECWAGGYAIFKHMFREKLILKMTTEHQPGGRLHCSERIQENIVYQGPHYKWYLS